MNKRYTKRAHRFTHIYIDMDIYKQTLIKLTKHVKGLSIEWCKIRSFGRNYLFKDPY